MDLYEGTEKILAYPSYVHDGYFWWPFSSQPGVSRGPIHLHNFLRLWLGIGMRILGISAFYHDSAAALVEDGRIIAAAQEERFTRKKHDARFPRNAITYCLDEARIAMRDVDYVVL